jgi:hypothetical protein
MAESQQNPILAQKPSDTTSDTAAFRYILERFAIDFEVMIPAVVVSFDRTRNVARVKPQIMFVGQRDQLIPRNELIDICVLSLGGGGYHISFPLKPGSNGWIYASDRDISLWKQTLTEQYPPTDRFHKFADGLFVPDVFSKYVMNAEDSDAMVIQSTDGATRISIRSDNIKITAPSKVLVDVPLAEFSKDVKIDGNLTVEQSTTLQGPTAANGGFGAASGKPCDLPTETTVAGKRVDHHVHGGVQPGNANTNQF